MFHRRWAFRSLAFATLLLATALASVASAQDAESNTRPQTAQADDGLAKKVDALLGGIESVPTAEQWRKLGPGAGPILVAILSDADSSAVRRGRAAIALTNFPTPETAGALRSVLESDRTPKHVRRKAIIALVEVEGDKALDVLAAELGHASKRVRETAIKAVGELATDKAQDTLRARLWAESSKRLRGLIASELERPVRRDLAEDLRPPKERPTPSAGPDEGEQEQ